MGGKMRRQHIRAATFLFALLLIVGAVTPIAPMMIWLLPAPLLYMWLYGERVWVMILCLMTALLTLFGGSMAYLAIPVIISAVIAATVGEAWRRGQFPLMPLAVGTIVTVGMSVFFMGLSFALYGFSIPNEMGQEVKQMILQHAFVQAESDSINLKVMANDYQSMIQHDFPSILVMVCFLIIFANVYLVRQRFAKHDQSKNWNASFADWKLPVSVVWLSLGSFVLSYVNWPNDLTILPILMENVMMLSSFFLALQGLSLIWRAISRYHIGKWSMLAIVASSMFHIVWLVYIAFGIFDCFVQNQRNSKRNK
ncbi:YybS family protein [Fodinisporobacter ferrooxydans]|uniref:YybS family protein n=1 Tax=Fodinisporobacter ferrooxydans TaxID=2901836 RepID=A0ABY4CV00_9BACL|nr:YybS family protein [Alicyclobacillaceae bacterium MYW30-H2]